jgi:hypothetical protein
VWRVSTLFSDECDSGGGVGAGSAGASLRPHRPTRTVSAQLSCMTREITGKSGRSTCAAGPARDRPRRAPVRVGMASKVAPLARTLSVGDLGASIDTSWPARSSRFANASCGGTHPPPDQSTIRYRLIASPSPRERAVARSSRRVRARCPRGSNLDPAGAASTCRCR